MSKNYDNIMLDSEISMFYCSLGTIKYNILNNFYVVFYFSFIITYIVIMVRK